MPEVCHGLCIAPSIEGMEVKVRSFGGEDPMPDEPAVSNPPTVHDIVQADAPACVSPTPLAVGGVPGPQPSTTFHSL